MKHRTWFPFILIGLTLLLFLIVLAVSASKEPREVVTDVEDEVQAALPPTIEEYQRESAAIVTQYQTSQDAQSTHAALLALRVPSEMTNVHLSLVLLFAEAVNNGTDILEELEVFIRANPWLSE